ncbi:MAG: RNA polymerase sigma factor [Eubacteriales bacterium]|nr:RNA polymerase sigma factor [Eubacteriales bacterium]
MTEQVFCETAYSYQRLLYHVAYTILRDNRECEDAVQEALLRAWEKRDTLRDESAFRFWLTRILTNTCVSMLRRTKRTQTSALDEETPAPFDDGMENRALHDAIGQLPQELRLPIVLHYLEGFSTKEIAALIRRPEGTVRNRLFRAREALRNLLGEEMDV